MPQLPDDIEKLKELALSQAVEIAKSKEEIAKGQEEINRLLDIVKILQKKHYAPASETVSSEQLGLGLFNEIEEIASEESKDDELEDDDSTDGKKRGKGRGKRVRIPESLPRVDKIIDLPEDQKICPQTGQALKFIGEEISEQLEITPPKVTVIRTIRKKYADSCCQGSVMTAPAPPCLLPKTMATSALLAYIITAKFCDALPLYRQEAIFKRVQLDLNRQTMARWLIQVSEKVIPLYNLLQEKLLAGNYIQMDETTIQVLKEKDKKATTKSYVWVRFLPGDTPIVLFDYARDRSRFNPIELLEGFKGYLQVDGYDGYSEACEKYGLIRLGCMDHCRRKFEKAYTTSSGKGIGKKALIYFKKLYKIEERITDFSPEAVKLVREKESVLILKEMHAWLQELKGQVTPKSVAGEAVNYALNEWVYLERYTLDGRLRISNILVENKIRPFAIGRKNWLFSASVEGAKASALYYSLIETAKANGLDPFDYLNRMLDKLPHAESLEDFERLLPLKGQFLA